MLRKVSIFLSLILCTMTSCVKPEPDNGPDETRGALSHMSVYKKGGADLGVIFYVNPTDAYKGKAVSSAGGLIEWAKSNDTWRIDSYNENYDYVHTVITTTEKYIENPEHFPAVKFCDEMRRQYGGNWHVPSQDEMNTLFNAYSDRTHSFDSLLVSIGGDSMLEKSSKYWLCAQNSDGNMQYVNMSQCQIGDEIQTTKNYVRCILDIDNSDTKDKAEYPKTNIGKLIKGPLTSRVDDILWDTTYNVTNGLDYYQMRLKTSADEVMDTYLLRVDLTKDINLRVAVARDTKPNSWIRETLTDMAAYLNHPLKPVYAMVNGDFCDNRSPIRPRGPVHCFGEMLCTTFSLDPDLQDQGLTYVGVTYDGKMMIGLRDEYDGVKMNLRDCTGGGVLLVDDSKIVVREYTSRHPRTAIGHTSGNIVWILAVDGRHKGTEGMTYTEMASIFFGLGCEAAINLDGGGSTEMLTRNPLTGKIQICNWPSDPTDGGGGEERPRPNAWAVVGK